MSKEKIKDKIASVLEKYEMLVCTRVWSAWGYNTMSEDDFELACEDENIINEIYNELFKEVK